MMYDAYQGMADAGDRVRLLAANAQAILNAWSSHPYASPWRRMAAGYELVALAGFTHARPDYGIDSVEIGGQAVRVEQRGVTWTPFCQLLRFQKEGGAEDPKILLVAPMSGHFATLLRGTIRTLLRDHQVYVTDWINPRNVKQEAGGFGLEDYTRHLVDFVRHIGEDCHVVAVCQPTVSALAATAVMAQEGGNVQPASLTLMAGPIDARVAPTKVNELAQRKADRVVPRQSDRRRADPVRGRRAARLSRLPAAVRVHEHERRAPRQVFRRPLPPSRRGRIREGGRDQRILQGIFRDHGHERGFLSRNGRPSVPAPSLAARPDGIQGRRIEPRAIRKTFLLTVEGEKDDICAVGQTLAAQDLCSGLRPYMKTHHLQPGVGHYGVFNGRRWETQVYPVLRNHIQAARWS